MHVLKNKKAFTLVEMLISLLIISVISLLVLPAIGSIRESVNNQGNDAFVQMIESNIQLYELEKGGISANKLEDLKGANYITEQQYDKALEMDVVW